MLELDSRLVETKVEVYRRQMLQELEGAREEKRYEGEHKKAVDLGARLVGVYAAVHQKIEGHVEGHYDCRCSFVNAQSLYIASQITLRELEGLSLRIKEKGNEQEVIVGNRLSIDFGHSSERLSRKLMKDQLGMISSVSRDKALDFCRGYLMGVSEQSAKEGGKEAYQPLLDQVKKQGLAFKGYVFDGFCERRIRAPSEKTKLDEVGGNVEAKQELSYLIKAFHNPEKRKEWGYVFPKGLLFYGPPGTGKTLLARALATETNLELVEVQVTDFLNKWAGESERRFEEALSGTNRIFFLDELDSIGRDKRLVNSDIGINIVNILALKMNEVKPDHSVVYIAATNEVKSIDKKLRTPHRFSRIIPFHYPGREEIGEIAKIHMKKRLSRMAGKQIEEKGNDLKDRLANKSEELEKKGKPRLVGADIAEIVERTFERCFRRDLDKGITKLPSLDDFVEVIEAYDTLREEVGVGV
ncbi:MAG: ATP-binding protein [Nanoarchaeota archaeon]